MKLSIFISSSCTAFCLFDFLLDHVSYSNTNISSYTVIKLEVPLGVFLNAPLQTATRIMHAKLQAYEVRRFAEDLFQ